MLRDVCRRERPVRAPLMTLAQAAEQLQVSIKTLRRRIADDSLAAHRIGRQWRIDPRDLDDFLRTARHGH
jgi:excisionase family DNA binding protein